MAKFKSGDWVVVNENYRWWTKGEKYLVSEGETITDDENSPGWFPGYFGCSATKTTPPEENA